MTERSEQRPLLERLGKELGGLGGDLRESVVLRYRLAMLEIKADLRNARRLAIVLAVALVMALTALPLLLVTLAHGLAGFCGLSSTGWLLLFGLILLLAAPIAGWLGWRRFKRHLVGLEQTLEELHEDTLWFQEWMDSKQ